MQPFCLQHVDTDGDGEPEWLGLYMRPSDPPRVHAFVMDGSTWYDLLPVEKATYGLGEYAVCEVSVQDVNNDGRIETLVFGYAPDQNELLHVFVWDGISYALLAPFEGNGGVRLEDSDGDLADEVIVGYRAGNGLVWEVVYVWDGTAYGWEWDRHRWLQRDRPHLYPSTTPELALISFYLAVDDRDMPAAYRLLTSTAQAAQPYETWIVGFATTLRVDAAAVHQFSHTSDDVVGVAAQIRAYDAVDGRVIARLWDVEWTAVRTEAGWRLEGSSAEQLDEWELAYYP
ncbi:MAG: hypothetical protein GX601_13855 [Anaerolineales bacterium]|nr:hypothetical protein [Anaerolineales bacterium]